MSSTYRYLGRSGVAVSSLALGTINFGEHSPSGTTESARILDAALDAGINFIDTADVYGRQSSEEFLGKHLGSRRDDIVLATKFYRRIGENHLNQGSSRRWIRLAVENSLRRLRTDRIDLYQAHRHDVHTDLLETISTLNDLIREGKILYYGTSAFPVDKIVEAQWIAKANGLIPPLTEQPPYSLLSRAAEAGTLPVAQRYDLGVLTYSPVAGGWLSGAYTSATEQPASSRAAKGADRFDVTDPVNANKLQAAIALGELADEAGIPLAELAVAWVINHPGVTSAIIGPRTVEHLQSNLRAAERTIPPLVLDRIDQIISPGTSFLPRDVGDPNPALEPRNRRRSGVEALPLS